MLILYIFNLNIILGSRYLLHYKHSLWPETSTKYIFFLNLVIEGIRRGFIWNRWRKKRDEALLWAQSRMRKLYLFMWRRYWGLLTFLPGLHKMDKSPPSLNMLSILKQPPDTNPPYIHPHPAELFSVNLTNHGSTSSQGRIITRTKSGFSTEAFFILSVRVQ